MPRDSKKTAPAEKPVVLSGSSDADIEENKGYAVIAYLWLLCLIPLLTKKDSAYAQFHAKQGLVLAIAWFLVSIVMVVPILGWLIGFFGGIVLLVVNLLAIIKAWAGEKWEIPYLYQYVEKLNL